MSFNVLNRRLHYWAAAVIAVPLCVVIGSGVLLQVKKHWSWVQPAERRGTGTVPVADFPAILAAVQVHEPAATWGDVNRMDVRPGRGVAKVWMKDGWEVQVDLGTGRVLQSAYRRSDTIEAIHDGSFFGGEWVKLGLFLPSGGVLLFLWASGVWMWWLPIAARRRRAAAGNPVALDRRIAQRAEEG